MCWEPPHGNEINHRIVKFFGFVTYFSLYVVVNSVLLDEMLQNRNSDRHNIKKCGVGQEYCFMFYRAPFSEKGRIAERGWKRISYLTRMFLAELGLSEWASREFWAMLFLFLFTFFMRIYLHYTGQYLFLKVLNIPINRFAEIYATNVSG